MLGKLSVRYGEREVVHFRTEKAGSLLAYLAYYCHRVHPRDTLSERFWPDLDTGSARTDLRRELTALRHLFDDLGLTADAVLKADRANVSLDSSAIVTDVAEFEAALNRAEQPENAANRETHLAYAADLYRGPLLPGHYDDWVRDERERLAERHVAALRQLSLQCVEAGEVDRACEYAHRAISEAPGREALHCDLMRLYEATGRPTDALIQFETLERLLAERGEEPGEEARELNAAVRERAAISAEVQPASSPHRLPHYPDCFVGRDDAVECVLQLITRSTPTSGDAGAANMTRRLWAPSSRLITLTGPGGSGKTRLAVEVAQRLTETSERAVWFVSLAGLSAASLLVDTLLHGLDIPRAATVSALDQVAAWLSRQPSLLVLDHCEHLDRETECLILTLLAKVPGLTCLATSRRSLNLAGEHEFPVEPLPTPTETDAVERPMECASVQLFIDRAKAVAPLQALQAPHLAAIAGVCRRLDGTPLAIELIAARSREFTPTRMLHCLTARFDLNAASFNDSADRPRSLHLALDWSFSLLPEGLQRLLARLSVFRGGFTAEAAEIVCDHPHVSGSLLQLRHGSLLVVEVAGGEMRYRVPETVGAYAAERLEDTERGSLRRRHADYFRHLAEQVEPLLKGEHRRAWIERLETELPNFRAALDWCLTWDVGAEGAPERQNRPGCLLPLSMGLRMVRALRPFWRLTGRSAEGRTTMKALLACV
jgi:predicted ATPase/DNA-binding SARP family transcriptional activator